ncbi:MAG: hypothetical protein ACXAEU_19820 [Candidatus Hodarchaeales archaeon]|jgi:hypothetical protein
MPACGLSIITGGYIYPPRDIYITYVINSEEPVATTVVEVRPQVKGTIGPESVGPAGIPSVVATSEVQPKIVSLEGPAVSVGQDEPSVISTEELRPQIRKIEEED